MSHLTRTQTKNLEQALRLREAELNGDVLREVREDEHRHLSDEARDAGDHATASVLNDVNQAVIVRDVRELRAIASTLRRMRSDEYGICESCGDDIPFARLRAQPTAIRCNRCQSVYERTHADNGRGPLL